MVITNSTSPDIDGLHITHTDLLVISIVAIVVGLALTFLGRKLFKPALFVAGFISFGGLAYYCMHEVAVFQNIHFTNLESILIPAGIGLVGGCIVLGVLKIGFFLAGAVAGAAIAFMIFALIGNKFGEHGNIIRLAILIVLSLLGGVAVVKQEKKLIIIITSITGAYVAMAGADHFLKTGYVSAINGLFIKDKIELGKTDTHLILMLVGTVALAVVGFIVQVFTNRNAEPEAGWGENQYLMRGKSVNY